MLTFTTCKDCKEILATSWIGQETHPTCKPSRTEQLTRDWLEAAQRGDMRAPELEAELNKKTQPELGDVAIWYVQQGWPVFPLSSGSKNPATRNGFKDATLDLDQIKNWWGRNPTYNIGLPTGIRFDVIDIDGAPGFHSLARLEDGAVPDVHGRVFTPRGLHLYVVKTGDGNRAGVKPGIDYRGKGGYVVAPPSRHGTARWSWTSPPSPMIIG